MYNYVRERERERERERKGAEICYFDGRKLQKVWGFV
jgi:hypothetical protein